MPYPASANKRLPSPLATSPPYELTKACLSSSSAACLLPQSPVDSTRAHSASALLMLDVSPRLLPCAVDNRVDPRAPVLGVRGMREGELADCRRRGSVTVAVDPARAKEARLEGVRRRDGESLETRWGRPWRPAGVETGRAASERRPRARGHKETGWIFRRPDVPVRTVWSRFRVGEVGVERDMRGSEALLAACRQGGQHI